MQGVTDSEDSGKYILQLPQITDTLITKNSTDVLTNKSISYSQITGTPTIPTNNNELTNGAGYITSSGNAATSTKLETARTIGGISFDGSANIDLPGVNISGNQDTSGNAATVTNLSLIHI